MMEMKIYKLNKALKILEISRKELGKLEKLPIDDERRVRLGAFISGKRYITEDELVRQAKIRNLEPKGKPGTDRAYTEYEKFMMLKELREAYED